MNRQNVDFRKSISKIGQKEGLRKFGIGLFIARKIKSLIISILQKYLIFKIFANRFEPQSHIALINIFTFFQKKV